MEYISYFNINTHVYSHLQKLPLMELFILVDGIICANVFFKNYIIIELSRNINSLKKILIQEENLVKKCNGTYNISTIDRYILYFLLYTISLILNYVNPRLDLTKLFFILFSFPFVQNAIYNISFIKKKYIYYNENKEIFIKYNISKLFIKYIENLNTHIINIPNYNIFTIYKLISYEFVYSIFKTFMFVNLLYFLKYGGTSLYYYYKAIKLAYYYETNFMFNTMTLDSSIYTINLVIKEKRWTEFSKIEISNALYILMYNKYYSKYNQQLLTFLNIILLKIFSIWSFISILKLIYLNVYTIICFIPIYIYYFKFNIKNTTLFVVLYLMMMFNINDIVITLTIIGHKILFYILKELFFFTSNTHNIRKVLKNHLKQSINEIKDEFVIS